ncbi:MAG: helix-turn-helix domain-containing protein [Calothrix sp. SM1_7_51]|nr:helix-turn-helix domain-containing protein [Calothrix sp. SM1_7_51]
MINISSVNPLLLPSVRFGENQSLPNTPGVYFVLNQNGEILYIGQSINLRQRLRVGHHRYSEFLGIGAVCVAWLSCNIDELEDIEVQLIHLLKPILNNEPQSEYPGRVISKLSEYRKSKGLSQDELARVSGLTKTTIQNWENGRNLGAVLRVLKVCQELNVDIRDLFEVEDSA